MNRIEFMGELEGLLMGLPSEEREEAMLFYQNYFDDAGAENEADIIRELSSPKKVAETILADAKGDAAENVFTEQGVENAEEEDKAVPTVPTESVKQGPRTSKLLKIILVILIGIAALTFAGPVILTVVCVAFGLLCAAFGIFLGFIVGAIAIMIGGFAFVILGLTKILVAAPVALATCGIGLILFALGLAATVGCVKLCMIVWPAMFRGIVNLCRMPFHRQGKAVS